ncbi:hypothetical protein BDR22DRAFT_974333 [Usnea florida]
MHSSVAFRSWLHSLVKTGLDIGSFINQEIEQNPEVHVGWGKETLLNLFTQGDRPDLHFKSLICSDYECFPESYGQMKQPHWMHLLEKIKEGLYLYDPARTKSSVNEDQNAYFHSVGDSPSCLTDLTLLPTTMEDHPLGNLDEVFSELELKDHVSEHSDTSQIELDYRKHEAFCDYCWLSYKRTGIRGLRKALANHIVGIYVKWRQYTNVSDLPLLEPTDCVILFKVAKVNDFELLVAILERRGKDQIFLGLSWSDLSTSVPVVKLELRRRLVPAS